MQICIFTTNQKTREVLHNYNKSAWSFQSSISYIFKLTLEPTVIFWLAKQIRNQVSITLPVPCYIEPSMKAQLFNGDRTRTNKYEIIAIFLTLLLHSSPKAFSQPTVPTLVSLVLVDHAVSLKPACVNVILPNASPKETFTAITARRSIMLSSGFVAANQASPIVAIISCTRRANTNDLNACY